MSEAYTYEVRVGGLCCYFGQEDKVIPQPGDSLVILGLCDCIKKVTAKLKDGDNAVCGQALFMDPASGVLTITPAADCFYGIAKGAVTAVAGSDLPITVYTAGGFNTQMVTVDATLGAVTPALAKEARGVGIYFEARV